MPRNRDGFFDTKQELADFIRVEFVERADEFNHPSEWPEREQQLLRQLYQSAVGETSSAEEFASYMAHGSHLIAAQAAQAGNDAAEARWSWTEEIFANQADVQNQLALLRQRGLLGAVQAGFGNVVDVFSNVGEVVTTTSETAARNPLATVAMIGLGALGLKLAMDSLKGRR